MLSIERSFYLYSTPVRSVSFFTITESSVLMALDFYYKGMLEKVTMQRTQLYAAHAHVVRKIETDCFRRNVPIFNDQSLEFQEIWLKNRSKTT